MTPRQDFEKDNYIIKELASGAYGAVYASVPKHFADQILLEMKQPSNPLDISTARARLRTAIDATKILKHRTYSQKDLKQEIDALRALNVTNYPNIMRLKYADETSHAWMTFELLAGRELKDFSTFANGPGAHNRVLPVALAWHFVSETSNALLAIHEKGYVHGDIKDRNIMLRPSGLYNDYPDVVVVDFGTAFNLQGMSRRRPTATMFLAKQVMDLGNLHSALTDCFGRVASNNADFHRVLESLRVYRARADGNEHYVEFLTQVRDDASQARNNAYTPLPDDVVAYFREHAKIVSDDDFDKFFSDRA